MVCEIAMGKSKFGISAAAAVARPAWALLFAAAVLAAPAHADDRSGQQWWKKPRVSIQSDRPAKPAKPVATREDAAPAGSSNLTNGKKLAKAVTETEIVADRDER